MNHRASFALHRSSGRSWSLNIDKFSFTQFHNIRTIINQWHKGTHHSDWLTWRGC